MAAIERVLLVDDEDDIRTIGELALSTVGGWEVVSARSGAAALEAFARAPVDLVLLDVMMPQMDGPTTLAKLRETPGGETVPVIFMTAKVQPNEVAGYLDAGAVGVISKPFDPMGLADQVRALLSQA